MLPRRSHFYFFFFLLTVFCISCNDDVIVPPVDPVTPPVFDITFKYEKYDIVV